MSAESPIHRLPQRLRAIADLIGPCPAMADIGTDHGHLPIALVAAGRVDRAIAVDRRPAPLALARQNIAAAGLAGRIETRLGDGLDPLGPREVQVAVLAGLGGRTIRRVVGRADVHGLALRRLILQPERDPWLLRAWLADNGWRINDEALVSEGGRFYTAISVCRDTDGGWWQQWDPADRLLGQPNRRRGGAVLAALIKHHRAWVGAEVAAMQRHGGDRALLAERLSWLRALEQTSDPD